MANIGSLTADLRLESAAFLRELNKASRETARHTGAMSASVKRMQAGFAAAGASIKGAVLGFASVATVRSVIQLGKAAVTSADEIAASARKIGVSAEDLQRWSAAAEQADVNVTELETAFKMFQRNLAAGKIKAEGDTMTEAFANFIKTVEQAPTQLEKTRLAVAAGGRNAQVVLLLAASGAKVFSDELKNAFVVSNDLIKVGDELDDQWARIANAVSTGFQTGFLEVFAKGIKLTHEELTNFHNVAKGLGTIVGTVIGWIGSIANAFANLRTTVFNAREEIRKAQAERAGVQFIPSVDGLSQSNRPLPQFQPNAPSLPELGEGLDLAKQSAAAAREAALAQSEWNQRMQEGMSVWENTLGPMGTYQNEINKLSALYEQGAISAETFGTAQRMAAMSAIAPWLGVADTIAGALGQVFGENKVVAIAQAVINTAQGITAALAQGGMFGWVQAAAIAAAGAAQIATIRSTKPGTAKNPSVRGSSKSSAANESVGESTNTGPQTSITLQIKGDVFGPEHFRKIVAGINNATADGTVLVRMT